MTRLTTEQYLRGPETMKPMELVWGVVHEPPAPFYSHQAIVTRVTVLLEEHVRRERLGQVCVSPVDVILDRERALVVQPDVVFVSAKRSGIIRDRIWGAPDLVVEVLSPGTARRDRTTKLGWYRRYGVRECWLVDPVRRRVEVIDWSDGQPRRRRVFRGRSPIGSRVLLRFAVPAARFFE